VTSLEGLGRPAPPVEDVASESVGYFASVFEAEPRMAGRDETRALVTASS
jgi:hypothetical protein